MALVPCKPALIDLQAIGSTIDVVHLAKVPAHIVLNAVPSRGDLAEQARQAIEIYDIPCAPCEIGHRIGFVHAYNAGLTVQEFEPSSKASKRNQRALRVHSQRDGGVSMAEEESESRKSFQRDRAVPETRVWKWWNLLRP